MHVPATRSMVIAVVALLIVVGVAYAGLNLDGGEGGKASRMATRSVGPKPQARRDRSLTAYLSMAQARWW